MAATLADRSPLQRRPHVGGVRRACWSQWTWTCPKRTWASRHPSKHSSSDAGAAPAPSASSTARARLSSARVCASAAKISVLPRFLAASDANGVPRRATIAIALVLALACALPFSELVSISMLFYGATTAFEFAALVILRHSEPHTPRPFKVPLGPHALLLTCLPPLFLCMLLVLLASRSSMIFFACTTAASTATYFCSHGMTAKSASLIWRPQPATNACLHGAPVRLRQQPTATPSTSRPRYLFRQPTGGYGKVRTVEEQLEGVELASTLEQAAGTAVTSAAEQPQGGGGQGNARGSGRARGVGGAGRGMQP